MTKPNDPVRPGPLQPAHLTRDGESVTFQRSSTMSREAVNVEARTVEFALASEEPYGRWWGVEVLSHDRTAVRLGRLASGRHPLLMDHSTRDQVGVIERAWIGDDRKLRCIARFGKSARAEEIFQDVIDGIRSLVSVGYQIHDMKLAKSGDDGDEYLVTDWEPHEGSIVAVPADPTVGIGREAEQQQALVRNFLSRFNPSSNRSSTPAVPAQPAQPAKAQRSTMDPTEDTTSAKTNPAPVVDARREREAATTMERTRVREITELGKRFGKATEAETAIDAGTSYDAFREAVFNGLEKSGALNLAEPATIGLSKKEVQQFRFANLIAATLWPDDQTVRKLAAFEIDCARAAADKRIDVKADRQGAFCIPVDVLGQPLDMRASEQDQASRLFQRLRRDLSVGVPTAGGNLVATDLLGSSFIDILVAQMQVMAMGATILNDLQGNVAIPRATGGATSYWVAENGAPTESQQAFDQVALTPKTVGAFVDYTRRLLLQSSIAVEAFIRMDVARSISMAIDLAALAGTGASNQPRGILNTPGIGSVAGGANGAAPTWDNVVDLESAVANANAPTSSLGYLTNTKVRGKLKRTQKFNGTNGAAIWEDGRLNDIRAEVSNQVPSNLTKGSAAGICSALIYGNWADLIIALWGGLDIMLDPYTGATSGTRRVVALQDVDTNVRYPVSFSAMQDALTT